MKNIKFSFTIRAISVSLFLFVNFVPPDAGPVFTIKTKHNYFTTDNLGNIYAVNVMMNS
ncbi:MAG: hypothetical protein IPM51_15275 [Sphingobacteriaceae bacterium]|nr:hypothetical protein [Sphingobacteriaceae bacterium]